MRTLLVLFIVIGFIACQSKEEVTRSQYVVEGMYLYQKNCENCHQKEGAGFKKLYPALVGTHLSDRLSTASLACMIKNGIKTGSKYDGKVYQAYMPGNFNLQAIEIAEILTYLDDLNGKKTGIRDQLIIKKALNDCF